MIYFTGDTHGDFGRFSYKNFPESRKFSENDYVIVLGDFGLFWDDSRTNAYWRGWLESKPYNFLFVAGNHENYDYLNNPVHYSYVNMFGGNVRKFGSNIFMLENGGSYRIETYTFLIMGGGLSIDKNRRKEGVSWWNKSNPYGMRDMSKIEDEVAKRLNNYKLNCNKWLFGHMHENIVIDGKYVGLYKNIVSLDDVLTMEY
jgi:hypothetical protein